MDVVAIDPAARNFAYAVFRDDVLYACGYATTPAGVEKHLRDVQTRWIMEAPQDYARFGVAHQDLDRLRSTLRKLKDLARRRRDSVAETKPFQWKGNVPKRIHHNRVWDLLTAPERNLLPDRPRAGKYQHDVHDAVAVGMTSIGRCRRGGRSPT